MHLRKVILVLTSIVLVLSTQEVFADSWLPYTPKTDASENGRYFIRVDEADMQLAQSSSTATSTNDMAIAHIYLYSKSKDHYRKLREIRLPNRTGPLEVLITNRAQVVTLDNWHGAGYGKVVVIFDSNGYLVSSYELKDLYEQAMIERFDITTSSIMWRCASRAPKVYSGKLLIHDTLGGMFKFDLRSNKFEYLKSGSKCEN